jgi:hypothetical protein
MLKIPVKNTGNITLGVHALQPIQFADYLATR